MDEEKKPDYCFAVIEEGSGRSVELDILAYCEKAKRHFQGVWKRLHSAVQEHHKICQRATPSWALWKPWDWCEQNRPGYEGRIKLVAWCGDIPVGFLNVWEGFPSYQQPGKNLLYVEHLAAAPGNLVTEVWDKKYKAVGAALLAYAILRSDQKGFEGRLGFHVADEPALAFYRHINSKCQNDLLFPEGKEVKNPTPRSEHDMDKIYLETKENGAKRWLEEYRRE